MEFESTNIFMANDLQYSASLSKQLSFLSHLHVNPQT